MALPSYNDAIATVAAHLRSGHELEGMLIDLERTLKQSGGPDHLVDEVRDAHREHRPASASSDDQVDLPPTAE